MEAPELNRAPEETQPSPYNRGHHLLAWVTLCATVGLIFMGGLVTSHQAGMAVPDWPTTFDQNMFTYPVSEWKGGVFYEHTHRLAGSVVGFLSILLLIWTWVVDRRKWVRWLSVGILVAVCIQGIMGGLRVTRDNLELAIVHGCFAHAFLCMLGLMVAATSSWWSRVASQPLDEPMRGGLVGLAIAATIAIYLQLIAGAVMRHYQAGLAIPDFPTSYGQLLPPLDEASLSAINAHRVIELKLDPVTVAQIWYHLIHRIGALVVTSLVIVLIDRAFRYRHALLSRPAALLFVLLVTQFTLGVLTVLMRKPPVVASAHVLVGAITLLASFLLLVRALRLRTVSSQAQLRRPDPLPESQRPHPGTLPNIASI